MLWFVPWLFLLLLDLYHFITKNERNTQHISALVPWIAHVQQLHFFLKKKRAKLKVATSEFITFVFLVDVTTIFACLNTVREHKLWDATKTFVSNYKSNLALIYWSFPMRSNVCFFQIYIKNMRIYQTNFNILLINNR